MNSEAYSNKKCIFCGGFVYPGETLCDKCGTVFDNFDKESRISSLQRYENLTSLFEYTQDNIKKIFDVNEIMKDKMEKLYEHSYEIKNLLMKQQDEGSEFYYEFVISGELRPYRYNLYRDNEKDNDDVIYTSECDILPQVKIVLDYNSGEYNNYFKDKFLSPVPHTGVFAHPAFDNLNLCYAMDVFFNRQKTFTLLDALNLTESNFTTKFNIQTGKILLQRDKRYNRKDYEAMKDYCNEKLRRRRFDWNYNNKMKVYALADRTTELLTKVYKEAFRLQKIFNDEYKQGKNQYSWFEIEGSLKYHNHKPFGRFNKKEAYIMCEAINKWANDVCSVKINNETVDDDKEFQHQLYLDNDCNWNIEDFSSSWVGNHSINYFMHAVFCDSFIYYIDDILSMDINDWKPQFNIYINDDNYYS